MWKSLWRTRRVNTPRCLAASLDAGPVDSRLLDSGTAPFLLASLERSEALVFPAPQSLWSPVISLFFSGGKRSG